VSLPRVVAVVVNHDGGRLVEEAVASLLAQRDVALEAVVVDNASSDGSPQRLADRFGAALRVLHAPGNVGFGAGCNLGFRTSDAPWVLLLNPDARAEPDLAARLIACAEADPLMGMVAPKVWLDDGARPSRIDTCGHLLYRDGLNRGRGRLEVDAGQYDKETEALFPSGAAALFRRSALDEAGGFDESYFLYGDDAELGLRLRLLGWRCGFEPRATAWHRYSQSVGAWSELKAYHVERNRVLVLLTLLPWSWVLASPAWTALRLGLMAWGAATGRGAAARLGESGSFLALPRVALRAWRDAALRAPAALRARRRTLGGARLSAREWRALLARYRLGAREVSLTD
jgi:GT2 family glycosyltransferase